MFYAWVSAGAPTLGSIQMLTCFIRARKMDTRRLMTVVFLLLGVGRPSCSKFWDSDDGLSLGWLHNV